MSRGDAITAANKAKRWGKQKYKWVGTGTNQIQEYVRLLGERAEDVVFAAFVDMASDIRQNTPEDTSRLKANWRVGLNGTPGPFDPEARDPGNAKGIDVQPIMKFSLGDRLYVYNKTPYARIIEGLGSLTTGPGGMIAKYRVNWPKYVDQSAMKLEN